MAALKYLLEKEFKQFARNRFLPRLMIVFPIMVMLVMPWITTMDIRNIRVTIVDKDGSGMSRDLIQKINASSYFVLTDVTNNYAQALEDIEKSESDVMMEIPEGFERDFIGGTAPRIQISANSVNGTVGSMGGNYLSGIVSGTQSFVSVQNRYNPFLNYRSFMIPALMVVLIIMLCGYLPALNIVGEKESGTIEQMNVTPVGKSQFILAKLIPYWIMGMLVLTICFTLAWAVYGLVPCGNILIVYLVAVFFILTMSGLGLVISNYSATMQQAMFVMFFFVMVFTLMSGLFTPVRSMPEWAQWIAAFIPPRYFVEVMRNVYLKGSGFMDVLPKFLALGGFVVFFNVWAIISYKKRV